MGLGIWLIVAMLSRQKIIFKNIVTIFVLWFFLSIPFWINHYKLTMHPVYDFLEKTTLGVEYSHRPIIELPYIFIAALIIFWNRKSQRKVFYFLFSFLIGGVVCLNQQVITGKIIEPIHFSTYTNKTFMIIALISGLNKVRIFPGISGKISDKAKLSILNVSFILSIVFLCFMAFIQQNNYFHANKKIYADAQALSGPFNWLNSHTDKEDVILTDSIKYPSFMFVRDFLLYTSNYHYLSTGPQTLVSQEEMENRTLSSMRFFGYLMNEAEAIFRYEDGIIFFGMSSRYRLVENIDEYVLGLKERYANYMDKDPFSLLKQYKVDYLLLAKGDHLYSVVEERYPVLTKVYDDGSYKIYRFH